jgi:hypothetical protein
MRRRQGWLVVFIAACQEPGAPARPLPATLEIVSSPSASVSVGTLAGNLTVRVLDVSGQPISGATVLFTVSRGGGAVTPAVDTTDGAGHASTTLTVGTTPGQNEITASVANIASVKSAVVATPGTTRQIALTPASMRFLVPRDSAPVTAMPRDSLGNATGLPVTWVSRNPTLVSVTTRPDNNAFVRVESRPGQTYVVATSGGANDSVLVSVVNAGASPCLFAAAPATLAVGASVALENGVACIRSETADERYAVVAHLSTPAATAVAVPEILANGIVTPAPVASTIIPASATAPPTGRADFAFESRLRDRERRELPAYVPAARAWWRSRPAALVASLREGDRTSVNVNAFEFCSNPQPITARVAAITETAVILADADNPPGGFTDDEYRAFGIAMDTLVSPIDTVAFGAPSDIDGNGRVAILFTKAVNEITPGGSEGGIALGFFYARDLLPRFGAGGSCPGSNVGEMFYILVPDPNAVFGDARSKAFVGNAVVSTIAHEYQHLINASRRIYVTNAPSASEEVWLDEGLSHIAEELVFYRASGLQPRQNISATQLVAGSPTRELFDLLMRGNLARYQQYLRLPGVNSPLSTEDLLGTRGATWALLRYLADRAGPTDGDLWYRLANSQRTGFANLQAALSQAPFPVLNAIGDWSIALLADDQLPSGPEFQQTSWNFVSAMPAVGMGFDLLPNALINALPVSATLRAGGSLYYRFAVQQGQEALIQFTGFSGAAMPAALRLTVLRTR